MHYKIVIEFEAKKPISAALLNSLADDCVVQLETLEDHCISYGVSGVTCWRQEEPE